MHPLDNFNINLPNKDNLNIKVILMKWIRIFFNNNNQKKDKFVNLSEKNVFKKYT